ncbi:hypothetical protein QA597_05445 [Marinilabiliaceae bacterium ANBcel2]|nr:hypothetical protein [Marinilabiliaceae bacterium ANBcel2]
MDFLNVLRLTGYPISRASDFYNQLIREFASSSDFKSKYAWEIFDYHYKNNSFYQQFVGNQRPATWEEIPVIGREDLKRDFLKKIPDDISSKELYISSTSGSSGDPLWFARDKFMHALIWLNVSHLYQMAGVSINSKQARFYGMPTNYKARCKSRLKDRFANRYRFDITDLSDSALKKWISKFRKKRFNYIYGYSNTIAAFAYYLNSRSLILSSVAPSLKAVIVTSEVCSERDRSLIASSFGIPVYNEYGSSELGVMGFKYDDKYWHISERLMLLEVLNEEGKSVEEGEAGYLTSTLFHNRATPFIRYQTGDIASIKKSNGNIYLSYIAGSLNDMAILPSGRKIPGINFYFVVENILDPSQQIDRFLVKQKGFCFTLEYVAKSDLSNKAAEKIIRSFSTFLGSEQVRIEIKRVEELQRGVNGKFKHFIYEG